MIICFDLETTWLDKYNDEIIEIALTKFDEHTFETIDTFSTFVKPSKKIPTLISNITNIFDNDVENAPPLSLIENEILAFIWDLPLLGHNVFFDRDFLLAKWLDIENNTIIDTFFLANFLCFHEPSLNLEMLCKHFGIPFSWAHRAINDVKATIALFQELIKLFSSLEKEKKQILYFILSQSQDKNIIYLKNLLFEKAPINISFSWFEKTLLHSIWTLDQNLSFDEYSSKDIDTSRILSSLPNTETRKNQDKMLQLVMDTFQNPSQVVIEAPTGLWKSFAYLIPAIYTALQKWEKIFISTKTKTLQDQLYEKDLRFLHDHLPLPFSYTKLKWKRNYISLKNFFEEIKESNLSYEKVCFYLKITLWLLETEYGELDELRFYGQEYFFQKYINAETFLYNENKYLSYEFLQKAKQKVDKSHIVIVNHALLFSDRKGNSELFEKIDNLVIDEAHSLEDAITETLRESVNYKEFETILSIIESKLKKKKQKLWELSLLKETLQSSLWTLFDISREYIYEKIPAHTPYKTVLAWDDFYISNDSFQQKLLDSSLGFLDYLALIKEIDFSREIQFLESYFHILKIILLKKYSQQYIRIIKSDDKDDISLEVTLLNPGDYLQTHFWNHIWSIILTSATLRIWENFDYIKKTLSLNEFSFYAYESDFDYENQSTLFIPNDLWSIKNNSAKVIDFLGKFYWIVRWKTLTLLTSYNMIRQIYTGLNQDMKKKDIQLYAQWLGWSRSKILSCFLEDSSSSILLGTDSFWEWIDIPWDDLQYLVHT